MNVFVKMPIFLVLLAAIACSQGSGGGTPSTYGGIDRSILLDTSPPFEVSPIEFPNGIETDLDGFGGFNGFSDCDVLHYGWDFAPNWSNYPDNLVPVIAVADGIISGIVQQSTNFYNNQPYNTFAIVLSVAKEVDIYYTFEPFITFNEANSAQWIKVSFGSTVSAGDVLGYLPKVSGNAGEGLIHLDWKVGTGPNRTTFVCPTSFFSPTWQAANAVILAAKMSNTCPSICTE